MPDPDPSNFRRQGVLIGSIGLAFLLMFSLRRTLSTTEQSAAVLLQFAAPIESFLFTGTIVSGAFAFTLAVLASFAAALSNLVSARRGTKDSELTSVDSSERATDQRSEPDMQTEATRANVIAFPMRFAELERWTRIEGPHFDISYKRFDNEVLIEFSGRADQLREHECLPNPLHRPSR